jgi:hypothetical protein
MPNLEERTGSEAAPTESTSASAGTEATPAESEAGHTEIPHVEISSPVQQPAQPFPSDLEVSSSVGVSHHPNET